jgi:hypothetical protein
LAPPSLAREGFLLRQASYKLRHKRSVLLVDFGASAATFLASHPVGGSVLLADVDSRSFVFPRWRANHPENRQHVAAQVLQKFC